MPGRTRARVQRGVSALLVVVLLSGLVLAAAAALSPAPASALVGIPVDGDVSDMIILGMAVDMVFLQAEQEVPEASIDAVAVEEGATVPQVITARSVACAFLAAVIAAESLVPVSGVFQTQYGAFNTNDSDNRITRAIMQLYKNTGGEAAEMAMTAGKQLSNGYYWVQLDAAWNHFPAYQAGDGSKHRRYGAHTNNLPAALAVVAGSTPIMPAGVAQVPGDQASGWGGSSLSDADVQLATDVRMWGAGYDAAPGTYDGQFMPIWTHGVAGAATYDRCVGVYDLVHDSYIYFGDPLTCRRGWAGYQDGWSWEGNDQHAVTALVAITTAQDEADANGQLSAGDSVGYYNLRSNSAMTSALPHYAAIPQAVMDGGSGQSTAVGTLFPGEGADPGTAPTGLFDNGGSSTSGGGSSTTGGGTGTQTGQSVDFSPLIAFLTNPLAAIVTAVQEIAQWCMGFFQALTTTVLSWVVPDSETMQQSLIMVRDTALGVWPFAIVPFVASIIGSLGAGSADVNLGVQVMVWPDPYVGTYVNFAPMLERLLPLRWLGAGVVYLMLVFGVVDLLRPQVEV